MRPALLITIDVESDNLWAGHKQIPLIGQVFARLAARYR